MKEQWEIDPTVVLRRAVSGMLPKNNLRKVRSRERQMMNADSNAHSPSLSLSLSLSMKLRTRKLQIFEGPEHDFVGEKYADVEFVPYDLPERNIKMKGRVEFLDHSKLPEGYQPLNREWYDKMCRLYKIANPYPAEVGDFKSKGEVGSKKD